MSLVQLAWEGDWAKFGLVWMILADPTVAAREVGAPILSKPST